MMTHRSVCKGAGGVRTNSVCAPLHSATCRVSAPDRSTRVASPTRYWLDWSSTHRGVVLRHLRGRVHPVFSSLPLRRRCGSRRRGRRRLPPGPVGELGQDGEEQHGDDEEGDAGVGQPDHGLLKRGALRLAHAAQQVHVNRGGAVVVWHRVLVPLEGCAAHRRGKLDKVYRHVANRCAIRGDASSWQYSEKGRVFLAVATE
jgi:hypothetical protein